MKRGKLIVFEGLDCSFKETNSEKLYKYLNSIGEKVAIEHFPRYGNQASYFVEQWLSGKYGKKDDMENSFLGSQLITSFYILDMFDYMNKIGIGLLNNGTNLILDRYYYSNIYFRLGMDFYKAPFRRDKLILNTEMLAQSANLPDADYIFKMKTSLPLMLDKIHEKNNKNDIHENDDEYTIKVFNEFEKFDFTKLLDNNGKQIDIKVYDENNNFKEREIIFDEILKKYLEVTRV